MSILHHWSSYDINYKSGGIEYHRVRPESLDQHSTDWTWKYSMSSQWWHKYQVDGHWKLDWIIPPFSIDHYYPFHWLSPHSIDTLSFIFVPLTKPTSNYHALLASYPQDFHQEAFTKMCYIETRTYDFASKSIYLDDCNNPQCYTSFSYNPPSVNPKFLMIRPDENWSSKENND